MLASTTITIIISETSYYIQNHQSLIAKQSEIIFHNLLFTIVCLEIFGLIFLLFKLAFLPLIHIIGQHFKNDKRVQPMTNENDNKDVENPHFNIKLTQQNE